MKISEKFPYADLSIEEENLWIQKMRLWCNYTNRNILNSNLLRNSINVPYIAVFITVPRQSYVIKSRKKKVGCHHFK